MDELISLAKIFGSIIFVLTCIFLLLSLFVKIFTIMELSSERNAYDLIAEEEELEIEFKKKRENREKELHKEQWTLCRKQQEQIEKEEKEKENEKRKKELNEKITANAQKFSVLNQHRKEIRNDRTASSKNT